MKPARYQELLGRLLEGELRDTESEELARALHESPALRQDLSQHLVLWEVWAQHHSPERSAEAFVQAWKTRMRAQDEDAETFANAVTMGIKADPGNESARIRPASDPDTGHKTRPLMDAIVTWIASVRLKRWRPALAAAVSLIFVVFAVGLWLMSPRPAQATTIRGEAVCTACVLHESQDHNPAIRMLATNSAQVFYLDRNQAVEGIQGRFCGGPTPATAKGKPRMEGNRWLFNATRVEFPSAPPSKAPNKNERILFPI